jgi:hypothetical protein
VIIANRTASLFLVGRDAEAMGVAVVVGEEELGLAVVSLVEF